MLNRRQTGLPTSLFPDRLRFLMFEGDEAA
jgi:hypothetical protein